MHLFLAIGLILLSIVSTFFCRRQDPINFRGFQGLKFGIIISMGVAGSILLIIYGLFPNNGGLQ